jgi:hypothetical protein
MYGTEPSQPAAKRFHGAAVAPLRGPELAIAYFADSWRQLYQLDRPAQAMPGLFPFAIYLGVAPRLAHDLGAHFFRSGMVRAFRRFDVTAGSGKYLVRGRPDAAPMTLR